jgi:hydroxyacyl-ACP dehydratase HTD2-like protein with hotdog domain
LDIDELSSRLGTELKVVTCEIEKGMIRRFVKAVDDPNPRWQVIAPPTFALTIGFEQIQEQLSGFSPSATMLHGSTELECYHPIKPRDVITASTQITHIRERQGKMGKTAFITVETTYKNQKQELVAKCRQMLIGY